MNLKLIKELCCMHVPQLRKVLCKFLYAHGYKKIEHARGYIMAEGTLPVCLIAHMDTVFNAIPDKDEFIYDKVKKILWYPYGAGFDDRTGIYGIMTLIEAGYHPSVLFTNEEEIGGVGAQDLIKNFPQCPFRDCRALIELDRAYEKDMVFYSCVNETFANYIEKYGFELSWGSFSDISLIAPKWEIAAVNLSIGYVDEHTSSERLYCDWCDATIEKVKKMLDDAEGMPSFSYIADIVPNQYYKQMFSSKACLFCGRALKNNIHMKDALDPSWDYYCCPSCYKTYHLEEDEQYKKI